MWALALCDRLGKGASSFGAVSKLGSYRMLKSRAWFVSPECLAHANCSSSNWPSAGQKLSSSYWEGLWYSKEVFTFGIVCYDVVISHKNLIVASSLCSAAMEMMRFLLFIWRSVDPRMKISGKNHCKFFIFSILAQSSRVSTFTLLPELYGFKMTSSWLSFQWI